MNADTLHRAIINAIEHETKIIVDDEAKKAAAAVEARVRGLAGSIATKIASTVDFETAGECTRITLRFSPSDFHRR